ncbi:MAG: hypothetical protein M3083_21650 [Actinomycetota bacterium]|nr:hypothetical protein [Actinomycetota bacterium]
MSNGVAAGSGRGHAKLAVLGKGGSGKTLLASLLVRALSGRGLMVLAVDLDANPGLAVSLGIPPYDLALPEAAVEERADAAYGWGLAEDLTPAEAVRRYAIRVADRVSFLGYGNMATIDTPLHRYLSAVRQVASGFDEPGWAVVVDLAAGPTTAFEGYARLASLALVTVAPTPTSILTGKRLAAILADDGITTGVVVMHSEPEDGSEAVVDWTKPLTTVPFDPEIRRLSRAGSLEGLAADSPALAAVEGLVTKLGF